MFNFNMLNADLNIQLNLPVSNDNYSSAYKDFKYLSNFGIISVCG